MKKTYSFAIVGSGTIAQFHADAIGGLPGAALAGVYDRDAQRAQSFAAHNGCPVFESWQQVLENEQVDIVSICTPSGTHAQLAVQAAQNGKHVVVEKPLAINNADAGAVVSAAKENGVQICVISQLRFSPAVQALRAAVQAGQLGRPVLASLAMRYHRTAAYYQSGGWRGTWAMDGGGALMNQGIHGVDLLHYICGPVTAVNAACKTLAHSIEVEDTVCARLEFASGAIGTLEATTAVLPGQPRRLEVLGTQGGAVLEEEAIARWDIDAPRPEALKTVAAGAANNPAAISSRGHRLQLENLLEAIRGTAPLLVDARQGSRTLAVVLAIYESAKSGKTIYLK